MLERYATLVFDCDGVVLDSNRVKTRAFERIAQPYGPDAVAALTAYHVANGGVSRFVKLQFLLDNFADRDAGRAGLADLVQRYGSLVESALMDCAVAAGLQELRDSSSNRWMIASGGSQEELRRVFKAREINHWFDAGIFGSPAPKGDILRREIDTGNLALPALYIGDSRFDHECASRLGLDFIFASAWTEFSDWQAYCALHGITAVNSVECLRAVGPRGRSEV